MMMRMGILGEVDGSVFLVLAVATAWDPIRQLASARRTKARPTTILASAWPAVARSLVWLAFAVDALTGADRAWFGWILIPVAAAGLATVAVPGISSRTRAGVPWWQVRARVVPPPPSAADLTAALNTLNPPDTRGAGPIVAVDANT
jgi:hypothetical protein